MWSPYADFSKERLLNLFDGGIYSRIDYEDVVEDPLNFKDTKKYTDRIKETRKKQVKKMPWF